VNRISMNKMEGKVTIVGEEGIGGEDTVAITNAVRSFIPGGKVDAVALMLSMSFFWASDSHLDALVNTIVNNLKPGGKIVFFTIDGDTVEQIFEPALGGPHVTDKTIVTAEMHLYPKRAPPLGRPLDFTLPGTIVGDEQREYIVHIQDFTSRLAKYGIYLHEIHRAESEKLLSEENKLYSSMYSFGYYVNDDVEALIQNTQVPLVNTVLTTIPPAIKFPAIEMNQPPITSNLPGTTGVSIPPIRSTPPVRFIPPIPPIPPFRSIPPIPPTSSLATTATSTTSTRLPVTNVSNPLINPLIKPAKLSYYQIDKRQLSSLHVNFNVGGNRVATNDDMYAPLKCTWYNNLVRIATIGDGSCFIHAVLKAFYPPYQDNNSANFRINMTAEVRRDLAEFLTLEDANHPGFIYWQTTARGAFPDHLMLQTNEPNAIYNDRIDFSLKGIQWLLNSFNQLGDEVYKLVSDALNIDIYILRVTLDDLYPHLHTHRPDIVRDAVVIIGNNSHYEVLAVDTEAGFQTIFPPDDPFLNALTGQFIGDGSFSDLVNIIPYDPDESFINAAVSTFAATNELIIPPAVYERFDANDPFRQQLDRLMPQIREAAHLRNIARGHDIQPAENPILTTLTDILAILGEQGYSVDAIQRIREIVEMKIDPDNPQSLDFIIASAVTDNLIDDGVAEDIMNVAAIL